MSRTGNALRNAWRPSETRCQAKQEVQESEASGARVTQTNMICKGCPTFGKKRKQRYTTKFSGSCASGAGELPFLSEAT